MKQNLSLYLALAGTLLVGAEAIATKYSKGTSYADAVKATTIVKVITVQSSTYHLNAALNRKRAKPGEAFEQYKNEPAQRWKKDKKNKKWIVCQGPENKQSTNDFEMVTKSYAKQASAVLSTLIDPLHAKHAEYAKRTNYAKRETAIIGQGKKSESYWPFS